MDEPARKRRKTSSPTERESSPLRKPPRRPSFASPTKASLARSYPSLVPTRPTLTGSPSRPDSRGDVLARGKQARAFVLGETDVQDTTESEASASRGARQQSPQTQDVTPRARRVARQRSTSVPRRAMDEEIELPTTPSQRGLEEQDGPRRGVLFSSPSKRPPRAKDPVKQSPLRPKAPPVQPVPTAAPVEDGQTDESILETKEKATPGPEVESRKQEKVRLQRELEDLEAQVTRCTQEIAREQQRDPAEALRHDERSELSKFLVSLSGLDNETEKATPISSLLCSFLPFSTIVVPPPRRNGEERLIPSHRPVELADPLPYLQMFTSFTFSTRLSLPDRKVLPTSTRVHQKHIIDITGPQKLLTAQISITIDTLKNEIVQMTLLSLSPWAERDLGNFLRTKATEHDLSNACWAIESYWHLAIKRAQYWHRCESTFAHLLTSSPANNDAENARPQAKQDTKLSRRNLNRHLGRETYIFQDKHVLLKVNWRLSFDWTGETESAITVEPAFPSVWTEGKAAKTAFSKVPDTFASLLQSRGVFEATRVMTALLFAA